MSEADRSALEEISIRNLGVIENAVVPFTKGLNVLTGETGAGKTMVLTALNLILGGKSDSALVRMRMAHEMESGQRKNAAGKLVPAWHIDQVTVQLNGKPVLTADWGPGVSRNPYLQFTLKKAKAGDKLTVVWRDNKGALRSDDQLLV